MSIYSDDLGNRFPTYTFTESVNGSLHTVDADNGGPILFSATAQSLDEAYTQLRQTMVGGAEILPLLTTTQRDTFTPDTGTPIFNETTTSVERYDGVGWVPTNATVEGNYTFTGELKVGGDPAIAPLGAISVIGDDFESGRIRTLLYSATPSNGAAVQIGHSRGTEAATSALLDGDRLGQLIFVGSDGTSPASNGPYIRCTAEANWSGSDKGSRIIVHTIEPGSTSTHLAMRFSQYGYPETPTYTVATLPNVGVGGGFIFVSDETGGATLAFSDGIDWRRVQDRAIVS